MNAPKAGSEVSISAEDAGDGFTHMLQEVREGVSYVVTADGHPIARLTPYEAPENARATAREALWERLRTQKPLDAGITWTREELYDDI